MSKIDSGIDPPHEALAVGELVYLFYILTVVKSG